MRWLNANGIMLVLLGVVVVFGEDAKADFTFGERTNLGPMVNSPHGDVFPEISADGLTLYFCSDRPDGLGDHDLWITTRASRNDPWKEAISLGPTVNSPDDDYGPSISKDGLELFFNSDRPGGSGENDLWVAKRATLHDDWGTPVNLGPLVNSLANDLRPCLSPDGLSLYFSSHRARGIGDEDLYVTMRPTKNDAWSRPVNLGETVNSPNVDFCPSIVQDGLGLIFSCRPSSMYGDFCSLWLTKRSTTSGLWETPVDFAPFLNTGDIAHVDIAPDGTSVFLTRCGESGGCGWQDIWQAPIIPIVDLNDDGVVDSGDMTIMVNHWGTDGTLCDIGPMPWGDDTVDAQDLMVLTDHLFEETPLPLELAAYWRLDEREGDLAYDSASGKIGVLLGSPVWRPAEGKRQGALAFDGVDDYLSTPFVLNPAANPYSVFAWMKGAVPGQVIVSQAGCTISGLISQGSTWLCTDPSDGRLMTELESLGRRGRPLIAQTVVTDSQWHHIGLVWDGSYRFLYVDGIEVAKDAEAMDSPIPSYGGLHIGAGVTLDATSFFQGLIDDVRIYNMALSAERIEALAL